MENISKINNTNIPNSILVKGISHDDFVKLISNIRDISNEAVKDLGKYQNVLDYVNKKSEDKEWSEKFVNQVNDSSKIIDEECKMMEEIFERIFNDWNEYQKDTVTVLETDLVENGDKDE